VLRHGAAPLAANLVFLLVFFLGMEGLCRLADGQAASFRKLNPLLRVDPSLFWDLIPRARGSLRGREGGPSEGRTWSFAVNGAGFRSDRELSPVKERGEVRIAVLGDSTTFGYSVNGDQTFCAVLERLLRAEFPETPITVMNCGVPGYCLYQSLLFFRERVLPWRPDLVVVKDCGNQGGEWSMKQFYGRQALGPVLTVKDLLHRSAFYLYLRRRLAHTGAPIAEPPDSAQSMKIEDFDLKVLEEFVRLSERAPWTLVFLKLDMRDSVVLPEQRELFERHRVPIVALNFHGAGDIGLDDPSHPGPKTHRETAERLAEALAPLIRTRTGK